MEQFKNILFVDIETVPLVPEFTMLPGALQDAWAHKSKFIKNITNVTDEPSVSFVEKAGVFSEFAKVVCIGFGSLHKHEDGWHMRLKALTNDDEKVLLNDFCGVLKKFIHHYTDLRFCGHNIKEFDIPFLCRRMVINGVELPECMQLHGKKPWEVSHLDTLELWRFGDHKHFTSLALLAAVLGIPSPKDDLDGSMVASVYWHERNLPRIAKYCLQDVHTSANVFLRLKGVYGDLPEPIFVTE